MSTKSPLSTLNLARQGTPARRRAMQPAPASQPLRARKVLLVSNTDWYLYNFRMSLLLSLKRAGAEVVLVCPPGEYIPQLIEKGFRWIPFEFERRSLHPAKQLKAVLQLVETYRRERPDVVHHFTIKCTVYGSLAARLASCRAVINAIAGLGLSGETSRHRLVAFLSRFSIKFALRGTYVIVQNPEDESFVRASGAATGERCVLIRGSGVDMSRFRPQVRRGAPVRALFAARLLWAKGLREFVEAAAIVKARHPEAEFLVAGTTDPGNPDSLTEADVESLKQNGAVTFLGNVSDMPALLSTCHLVVLPTVYGEGVPRILVEGAAAGLPLVATDVPGPREIIKPDVNGKLVAPGNIDQLVHALEEVIGDPFLRERFGRASRRLAEQTFSQEQVNTQTLLTYQLALRSAGAR